MGMDEAGRGPVIGPMVIAAVSLEEDLISELIKIGVKDSKKLTPKRREAMAGEIVRVVKRPHIRVLSAAEIDRLMDKMSLNQIEAEVMAEIVESASPDVVQVGSVDVNEGRFGAEILNRISARIKPSIVSVHHAEDKYPAVAAASIIAKTTRDRLVSELRKVYGDFGSGYPSDPKTTSFLKSISGRGELPPIVRHSWKTVKNIID